MNASGPWPSSGVVLVGYRGSGKSSVGRRLAARLGLPFHDADTALETRFGCTVRQVFQELGEPVFRDREHQVLAELTGGPPAVIATGGGAVLRADNRRLLRGHGFVVWLSADPQALTTRLAASPRQLADRPSLTSAGRLDEIAQVLSARVPLYREVSDAEVPTDGLTLDEAVAAVLAVLPDRSR